MDRRAIALATKSLPALGTSNQAVGALPVTVDSSLLVAPSLSADLVFQEDGRFTFPSHVPTRYQKNNLVHGRLYCASDNFKQAPTVLLLHGWNAELHYLHGFPKLAGGLKKRGMNTLCLELPFHLQRRPSEPDETRDFISEDLANMLVATRQALADIQSLLLWSRQRSSMPIAIWGFSLGAWLAGLHLAQSDAVEAAVLTTPISNLSLAIATLPFCFPIRAALQSTPIPLDWLNLTAHQPHLAPERILVTEGLYDLFAPAHTYPALSEKWKLRSWQQVPQSHISVLFSRKCMNSAMDWLRSAL